MVEGWRKIDNERGYMNETTGQILLVRKKQFGEHFVVLLFPRGRIDGNGETVSPEYATESKAGAYAMDWIKKHPRGAERTPSDTRPVERDRR